MHIHLPKPLHGWRAFVGEIGIVVIGVLIALAGEQLVEALHWRHVLTEYRTALRAEIAHNVGTYAFRRRQDRCVDARLGELQDWLDSWRAGHPLAIRGAIGVPESLSVFEGVWASRNAEIASRMPLSEQLAYSRLYDRFANNEVHRLAERNVWIDLGNYNGATGLDHQDLMRLQGLIDQARYRQGHFGQNAVNYARDAAALHIGGETDPSWPKLADALCRPILRGDGRDARART
jgi:hypothetical protein